MKTLHVFPSDPPLSPRWVDWFQKEGYEPVYYDPKNPARVETLLLITPVLSGDSWLTIEHEWMHYFLKKTDGNAKLIQAGIKGFESRPNYLHLYRLPANFSDFLNTCKPCSEDWQPIETGMVDLSERIRHFFDGHGTSGAWYWLTEARRFLNFLPLDAQTEDLRQELQNPVKKAQFDAIKSRWAHFSGIFANLPDQQFIPTVDSLLEELQVEKLINADDDHLRSEIKTALTIIETVMDQLEPLQSSLPPESTEQL